eukprot:145219-Pelagomonas_calceolata.AAC.11
MGSIGGLAGSGWARASGRGGGPLSTHLCLNPKFRVEILRFDQISSQTLTKPDLAPVTGTRINIANKSP